MERIRGADARIGDWSRAAEAHAPGEEPVTPPPLDPRELLEQERLRIFEAARIEGHARGMSQAEAEILARTKAVENEVYKQHEAESTRLRLANEQLAALLRALPQALQEADARVEAVAVDVAYAGTMRILGEKAADRSLIAALCHQALGEYVHRPVVVRVAAEDAAGLDELADGDAVRVVGDSRLQSGQCQLETHKGLFDTGLDVRLEVLKQTFLRSLAGPEAVV